MMAPRSASLLALLSVVCIVLPYASVASEFGLVQNMAYLKPIVNAPEDIAAAVPEPGVGAGVGRKLLQR